jgi:two-component system CheB/CheR fusion protein
MSSATQSDRQCSLDPQAAAVLARVAHEMRQPLSAAAAAVCVIKAIDTDAQRRDHACQLLERQCTRLSRLVEDLAVIARVGSDRTTLTREKLELNGILSDLMESFQPLITRKGLHLEVVPATRPCWMNVDEFRLDQVFSNIVANAIKYTDPGGRIWISVAPADETVAVTVSDTGRGIPPEMLPRVFEMFTTGSDETGRRGLGVGLAVARHLVHLHGGSIAIASGGAGCGTEVVVRLPGLSTVGK